MIAVGTNVLIYAIGAKPSVTLKHSRGSARSQSTFRSVCETAEVRGNLAFDAQIVASCIEHGVHELITADRDFARFGAISQQRGASVPASPVATDSATTAKLDTRARRQGLALPNRFTALFLNPLFQVLHDEEQVQGIGRARLEPEMLVEGCGVLALRVNQKRPRSDRICGRRRPD